MKIFFSFLFNTIIKYTFNFLSTTILFSILSTLFDFGLLIICSKYFHKISFEITKKYWMIMNFIIATCTIITLFFKMNYSFNQYKITNYSFYALCISLSFLLMNIMVSYLLGEISLLYEKEKENGILYIKNQTLEQLISYQEATTTNIKKIKHDINQHLSDILFFLNKNNISDAIKYIETIVNALEDTNDVIYTGNTIIDTILNYKIAVCKKNNIRIKLNVDELPNLKINHMDLSAIVSNMLDNAIEANLNVPKSQGQIDVRIFVFKNFFSIVIKNNSIHDLPCEQGLIKTHKSDTYNHGYGMKSIKLSSEKNGGNFTFYQEGNIFTSAVILPI